MKNLQEYINESLLDGFDNIDKSINIKLIIKKWILENIHLIYKLKISDDPNKDGKYEVSADAVVSDKSLKFLTNNMFIWKKVGSFNCSCCDSLKSLEGAPETVENNFDCSNCDSLTSLKGAPREVGHDFNCSCCDNLTSLKGAPREVGHDFDCSYCDNLTSLKGAPQKIGRNFCCYQQNNLKSYELPKNTKIKGNFIK